MMASFILPAIRRHTYACGFLFPSRRSYSERTDWKTTAFEGYKIAFEGYKKVIEEQEKVINGKERLINKLEKENGFEAQLVCGDLKPY